MTENAKPDTTDIQEHWDGLGQAKRIEILYACDQPEENSTKLWAEIEYPVQQAIQAWLEPDHDDSEELEPDDEEEEPEPEAQP